ncbi:MAG: HAD-IB family phosphatase [Deltaproteobacteria bacterium]|nr:HAD-IB family phosphatase [Deltaproteobacteria bacterium]
MGRNRFDLIAFDVDGTLVDDTVFVWETLHEHHRTDRASRQMAFEKYMAGEWSYRQWFEHDIQLLTEAGANHGSILDAISGMRLMEGALETLEAIRRSGARMAILSGSLDIVVEKFGLAEYFDDIYLNHIGFDCEGRLSEWEPTPYDVCDKATGLKDLAVRHGIPMERTAFVGDNFNDVAVARVAGFAIAFNCKSDELARTADVTVPGGDLRRVLPYLI